MKHSRSLLSLSLLLSLLPGCTPARPPLAQTEPPPEAVRRAPVPTAVSQNGRPDPHSFAKPDEAAVEHLQLSLSVDFPRRQLRGKASLRIRQSPGAREIHLDTRDLEIAKVTLDNDAAAVAFTLGEPVEFLGRELTVPLRPETRWVHVEYATRPEAAALQWMTPEQAGGGQPFLFTQSQAILARTWIPCQDTPGVRMTYEATVRVPPGLLALMSAENPTAKSADGLYRFRMPQAIPSYLTALAVGDLEFRAWTANSGVYAQPSVLPRAAWELADTPKMINAAERLYGPYRWGRYDLVILPASYPFGGMENPRLTFATPTILAGDRSLVSLVAHELAHSWSGNLLTNATWDDFWLNEGFTTYFERRIMEAVFGRPYAEMLAVLGRQVLDDLVRDLGPESPDTHLRLALAGRDPDEGSTEIAYEKGALFLRTIEEAVGRERFDKFLRGYFDSHAFQSTTTDGFLAALRAQLVPAGSSLDQKLQIASWIDGPGVPANAARITSEAFIKVDAQVAAFNQGTPANRLATAQWTTHEWLHFLHNLARPVPLARMADLDAAFGLSRSGNSEILVEWLLRSIESRYEPAYPALERFLVQVGRRKFLVALYTEMAKTPAGAERALGIYEKARPGYHSLAQGAVDKILNWRE